MEKDYDVIVIGAGLSGLATGALAASTGKRVLVLEKQSKPGGYCSSISQEGFIFDLGDCLVPGYSGGVVRDFLAKIGSDITFLPVEPIDWLIFPELEIEVPSDIDQFINILSNNFPEESNNIRRFFEVLLELRNELTSEVNRRELIQMYKGLTFEEMLNSFFNDLWLKRIIEAEWNLGGLESHEVSALAMCNILGERFRFGLGIPEGGMNKFLESILQSLIKAGGKVEYDKEVNQIIIEDGTATGIKTIDGTEIFGKTVVSCVDARKTICDFVGGACSQNYVEKLKKLVVSKGLFRLNLGLDPDTNLAEVKNGVYLFDDSRLWVRLFVPTRYCPNLAPPKHHILTATVPVLDESNVVDWGRWKDETQLRTLDSISGVIPNLENHIVNVFSETPSELEVRTGSSSGASFGWALIPSQYQDQRLSNITPIKELYLAGHWSAPGAGIPDVIRSAKTVVKNILS